jgi:hypothetical protein
VRGTHTWGQTWGSRRSMQRLRMITFTSLAESLVGGGDTWYARLRATRSNATSYVRLCAIKAARLNRSSQKWPEGSVSGHAKHGDTPTGGLKTRWLLPTIGCLITSKRR